jgi:hypothetical protein
MENLVHGAKIVGRDLIWGVRGRFLVCEGDMIFCVAIELVASRDPLKAMVVNHYI